MNTFTEDIIPSLRILSIAGDVAGFQDWLLQQHNLVLDAKLFHGYKFLIECAFSGFLDHCAENDFIPIHKDLIFNRARGHTFFPLEKWPHSCERTIFVKNLKAEFAPVQKAKNPDELHTALAQFLGTTGVFFENIFSQYFQIKENASLTAEEAMKLLLTEQLFLEYTQIYNNGPVAYNGALLNKFWIPTKKLTYCFEGYKYILQYLWHEVLGKDTFETTSLPGMHLAQSWSTYKYIPLPEGLSEIEQLIHGDHFNLEEQTCLDSYFYRIREEYIVPLEQELEVRITSGGSFYKRRGKIPKSLFQAYLIPKVADPYSTLLDEEKIDIALFWDPIEVFERQEMHNGVPAFITTLAGTVALYGSKEGRELKKVYVAKFVHKIGTGKRDYSYGIFIDSKAAAGHYYSGWLIYYDCCGDYSGFSGGEHRRAEEYIKQQEKSGIVKVNRLEVDKNVFRKYLESHVHTNKEIAEARIKRKEQELEDEVARWKLKMEGVFSQAKGVLLELLLFYALKRNNSHDEVIWSAHKKEGEIDLLVKSDNVVKLIECKYNPNNIDIPKVHSDCMMKLSRQFPNIRPEVEFWFWVKPSPENMQLMFENNIQFKYVQDNPTRPRLLKGVDLAQIGAIMNHSFSL